MKYFKLLLFGAFFLFVFSPVFSQTDSTQVTQEPEEEEEEEAQE